jgi:hypothetical protein
MKYAVTLLLLMLALFEPAASHAQEQRRSKVPCPEIVADKRTGTFQKGKLKSSKFECYSSEKAATKLGYTSESAVRTRDFSRWWRLRLSKVKDSCGDYQAKNGPVLFLQLRQNGQAVFGDFCPSLGVLRGVRTSFGFTAAATDTVNELSNPLGCEGGIVEKTQTLELSQMFDKSRGYSVRYVAVRRCPSGDEGFRIWPAVNPNPNEFVNGCGMALQRCADCHESLRDMKLVP